MFTFHIPRTARSIFNSRSKALKSLKAINYRLIVITAISVLILGFTGCGRQEVKPRNIVLMIGDGMGLNHVCAGMMVKEGKLYLENCEYTGFQKTYSASSDITDSGASGTALATGVKTINKRIAVDTEGNSLKTILEMAHEHGMATGLLATSTITHATPASFAAHNIDRKKYESIAADISRSGIDVIIGGGMDHFASREDGANLLDSMAGNGYYVGNAIEDLPENHSGPIAIFPSRDAMPSIIEGRGDILARATGIALERLSSDPDGFFIMVEGSQIDWEAHDNFTEGIIAEVIDFDKAIGEALAFAKLDGETLVIITADHETGGFSIPKGGMLSGEIKGDFSTGGHTGVLVPVFASGPGAENFSGIYENTDIFEKMKALLEL